MWIYASITNTASLDLNLVGDLLLELSPDVFLDRDSGHASIDISRLTRYWHLGEALEKEHPLVQKLHALHARFGLCFTLAPTAAWAQALHENGGHTPFSLWRHSEIAEFKKEAPLSFTQSFISDFLHQATHRAEWHYFLECMQELGVSTLHDLLLYCANPQGLEELVKRWGLLSKRLVHRLHGVEDMPLTPFKPAAYLETTFHPDLERQLSSEQSECLRVRFADIFAQWQERLTIRHSVIRGFEVKLSSGKNDLVHTLTLHLHRPTREAGTLLRLLFEKWVGHDGSLSDGAFFNFDTIHIKSMQLEFESDRQLNLFDPKREEHEEEWNLLSASLLGLHPSLRLGHYVANDSYWPEHAVKWQHWSSSEFLPMIENHPPRPSVLLTPPHLYKGPQSEIEFLAMLTERELTESLEKLRDPWRGEERTYASKNKQWLFWDHKRGRALVHGYFE
jgi:hypothetical protein